MDVTCIATTKCWATGILNKETVNGFLHIFPHLLWVDVTWLTFYKDAQVCLSVAEKIVFRDAFRLQEALTWMRKKREGISWVMVVLLAVFSIASLRDP